jgi:outer membrane protein assembly factor BamE (lipoprotein component of BamABCDE complex)
LESYFSTLQARFRFPMHTSLKSNFLAVVVLCLLACFIGDPAGGETSKEKGSARTSPMSYQDSLTAFDKIRKGMGSQEVRKLLGAPDRVTGKDPDQTSYDEVWTYDFRKRTGYPRESASKEIWEGQLNFLGGKVVHTRKIGFLER